MIRAVEHKIALDKKDSRQVHSARYQTGPRVRELKMQKIDRMLVIYNIEPAQMERAEPIMLVPRRNGPLHFCVKYQTLNSLTIQDPYSTWQIDERLDSVGYATIFSIFGCKQQILTSQNGQNGPTRQSLRFSRVCSASKECLSHGKRPREVSTRDGLLS